MPFKGRQLTPAGLIISRQVRGEQRNSQSIFFIPNKAQPVLYSRIVRPLPLFTKRYRVLAWGQSSTPKCEISLVLC